MSEEQEQTFVLFCFSGVVPKRANLHVLIRNRDISLILRKQFCAQALIQFQVIRN